MRDALGPGTMLGYCTNVHAGANWEQTKRNLQSHALEVKHLVSPHEPMGIGLWLSARAAREVIKNDRITALRDWLAEHGLAVFTMNGFPHGDFHEPVVKHRVYRPHWSQKARVDYTTDLIRMLADLIAEGEQASISTLPLGWGTRRRSDCDLEVAASNLRGLAHSLHQLESQTGKLIHLDLEPEPGCLLESSSDVASFFQSNLLQGNDDDIVLRHVRICHDVCHAAVMFEDQREVFHTYKSIGLKIGKVQISSAIRAVLEGRSDLQRSNMVSKLSSFADARYLHQTTVRTHGDLAFFEDLPDALESCGRSDRMADEWRVHFHVPIYLESLGPLNTTQMHIKECMQLLDARDVQHWEVETYAWDVLPAELKMPTLVESIARELQWVQDRFADEHSK